SNSSFLHLHLEVLESWKLRNRLPLLRREPRVRAVRPRDQTPVILPSVLQGGRRYIVRHEQISRRSRFVGRWIHGNGNSMHPSSAFLYDSGLLHRLELCGTHPSTDTGHAFRRAGRVLTETYKLGMVPILCLDVGQPLLRRWQEVSPVFLRSLARRR